MIGSETIYSEKCSIMLFTTKQNMLNFDYTIANIVLCRPEHFWGLGVLFDKKLSFNSHISKVISNAYKTLGFIIHNTKYFKS